MIDVLHAGMDGDISPENKTCGNRYHNAEHILIKILKKSAGGIIIGTKSDRIKVFQLFNMAFLESFFRIQQNLTIGIYDPDLGVLISA